MISKAKMARYSLYIACGALLLWSIGTANAFAQDENENTEEATIEGLVQDPEGQSIPYASVAIHDVSTSNVVTGASTDSTGSFTVEVEPGTYNVKITFLSFKPWQQQIEAESGETYDLGTLTLQPTTESMDEIVVEGERSQMEMRFDKRVFQVGSDLTNLGGSALNVLNNVPSVVTDIDGNISLRGNESVRILINGKPSNRFSDDAQALQSLPASMIKEVEIITNPSSKYSAEGSAGIINIILKKKRDRGLNGDVSAGAGLPQDYEVSTNLNYRTGSVNWFMSAGADYRSDPEHGSSFQRFASPDTSYMYREVTDTKESEMDADLRFGADFYLSDNEVLTASTTMELEDGHNDEEITYSDMEYSQGALTGDVIRRIHRDNIENQSEQQFEAALEYENKFSGDDHKLTAEADFDMESEVEKSNITETVAQGSADPLFQRTRDNQESMDLRVDADYIRPLGEKGKLEVGVRSSFDWMDNSYLVEEQRNGTWQTLQSFNDNFLYHENVNAAYLILGSELGSFSGQVGIRAENTQIRTELKRTADVNRQNYLDFFPSIFLNYSFNEVQSLQLSYTRRLSRPWSRMLLPFSDYSDSRSRFTGNPELKPEYSNSYEAGYLHHWKSGSVLTSFYYRHRTGVIERITTLDDDGITRIFPINLATEEAWGIEFSADQRVADQLTLTANANLYRSDTKGSYEGQTLTSQTRTLQGQLGFRWQITDQWNFQVSSRYQAPRETTQGRRAGMNMMDTGISRELFDGKATLSLNVRDLLDSQNYEATVNTDGNPNTNFYSHRQFSWSSRSFSLNFTYYFGRNDRERNRDRGGGPGEGEGGPEY